MKYFGFIAFILILAYSSYPAKITAMQKELEELKKKIKKLKKSEEGKEESMSKIIMDLVGKKCKIDFEDSFAEYNDEVCTVMDADDEWIKFTYKDKKNNVKTEIARINDIDSVEIIQEEMTK